MPGRSSNAVEAAEHQALRGRSRSPDRGDVAEERRLAADGYSYTAGEFKNFDPEWWSWSWERARPLAASPAPPGLSLGRVGAETAAEALGELAPHWGTWGHRGLMEVGWSYYKGEYRESPDGQWKTEVVRAQPLQDFPKLRSLLAAAMEVLGAPPRDDALGARLNVICRYYQVEDSIPMHCDKKDWFEEDVYGCVLMNSSDRALEFQAAGGSPPDDGCYVLPETPGACFCQRGASRFEWEHGVAPLARGERVSVSWRWFKSDVELIEAARDGDGAGIRA